MASGVGLDGLMSAPGEESAAHLTEGATGGAMPSPSRDYTGSMLRMGWMQPRCKHAPGVNKEFVPGPRAAHSCNLVGQDKLLLFGGWNGREGLADLVCLTVSDLTWSVPETRGTAPSARNNHSTFTHGSKLFIHGGHDGRRWLADFYCLDTDKMEWSQPEVAGVIPSARACHTITLAGTGKGKAYLWGGYDGSRCFSDLDVLDLETMTWLQPRVSGSVPQARNAQTVTPVGSRLFLFGGHSGNKHLRDLHILDTETLTWSQPEVRGNIPPGLRGHTASLIGSTIYLFGGYDGRGRSNDLYLLNIEDLRWSHPPANESTPAGRQRHTAVLVASKKLFVFGGFDGLRWLSDLHVLDVGKLEEGALTSASVGALLDDFKTLVNNPASFPDVAFLVEGEVVHAHKSILACRCEHFRAMFGSGMRESREGATIPYPDWSKAAFLAMLEFLYTGSVALTTPVALEVLGLADHIGLDGLRALSETALVHSVDVGNVCSLISSAHRFGAPELKRFCLDFILKHSDAVSLDPLAETPALLIEITKEVLARNHSKA